MNSALPLSRVIDLTDPAVNRIYNMTVDEARARVACGDPAGVRGIDGSFALVARDGKAVRMARSIDRPLRYFIAKRHDGPVPGRRRPDRRDPRLARRRAGWPSSSTRRYTRMVPAHHVTEIALVGCPDPEPDLHAFLHPPRGALPADLDEIGEALHRGARRRDRQVAADAGPADEPIGVCFSGGIDSGAVFLATYHAMLRLGHEPGAAEGVHARRRRRRRGPGAGAARSSRELALELFLEPIEVDAASAIDWRRGDPRDRGLQAARRAVGGDGAWRCCAASASATRSGGTCSTATAATRT